MDIDPFTVTDTSEPPPSSISYSPSGSQSGVLRCMIIASQGGQSGMSVTDSFKGKGDRVLGRLANVALYIIFSAPSRRRERYTTDHGFDT